MKPAAFILLASFIGYYTETIQIPLSFSDCKKTITCSQKTMTCSQMEEQCREKDQASKTGNSNSGDCNNICVNCPLNSVTLFEQCKSPFNFAINCKKEYPFTPTFLLSDYIPDTWKPPNNILA